MRSSSPPLGCTRRCCRDRPSRASATVAGARRCGLPQDDSRLLRDPQGRHGRRSRLPRHGRLACQHPARREQVLGGCGMRMDPPPPMSSRRLTTASSSSRGADGAARARQFGRAVSFEREMQRFAQTGYTARASALGASFGRNDLVGDLRTGTPEVYGQLTATRAASDDYDDGAGETVHSEYERWSANAALGWTPDERNPSRAHGRAQRWRSGLRRPRHGRRHVRS